MNTKRIKEIHKETAYPDSISVQQAILKVWNECEQERAVKNNAVSPLVSGSACDFYTDLMKLINAYCDKGLKKPDLVHKMEYATESCKLS